MPQQNWRETLSEFGEIYTFPFGVYKAQGYKKGATGTPQLYAGRCDTKTLEAFIETLLARVIEDARLYYGAARTDIGKATADKELRAKYLTQLRSEFGIEEGRDERI